MEFQFGQHGSTVYAMYMHTGETAWVSGFTLLLCQYIVGYTTHHELGLAQGHLS